MNNNTGADRFSPSKTPLTGKQGMIVLLVGISLFAFLIAQIPNSSVKNTGEDVASISVTSLPQYEKLSYGIAQNTILVSPQTTPEQVKLLLQELPDKFCPNMKICLVNIFDDVTAPKTDTELTNEFMDFVEKHFVGQYSSMSGVRRYKANNQWVNF